MRREVIVVLKAPLAQALVEGDIAAPSPSVSQLETVLGDQGALLQPVFDPPAASMVESPGAEGGGAIARTGYDPEDEDLARYFSAVVDDGKAETLVEQLNALEEVESAYIKPAVENPLAPEEDLSLSALSTPPVPTIPDFSGGQGYLGPAPGGVGITAAWGRRGGKGAGVRVIDIEGGWQFSHIDLRQNQGGLVGGQMINEVGWRNHGTAVLGEISGDENGIGVVGLAPDAQVFAVSHYPRGSAHAIQLAASRLAPGDILLLEMHRPGPRYGFAQRNDQRGYIAVEWWPDDLAAIRAAGRRGVIVVEAAGNGAEDLDAAIYDVPAPGFPASWRNPFRGADNDSGAIVVGAGAPPSGTFGPDRSRLNFSNWGARVDCQGWGREVVTTGYGDLFAGSGEDFWFTRTFSGTSSASPIVVGVLACVAGILKAAGRWLQPAQARAVLRQTGSAQQASASAPLSQRIGSRPNTGDILAALGV